MVKLFVDSSQKSPKDGLMLRMLLDLLSLARLAGWESVGIFYTNSLTNLELPNGRFVFIAH